MERYVLDFSSLAAKDLIFINDKLSNNIPRLKNLQAAISGKMQHFRENGEDCEGERRGQFTSIAARPPDQPCAAYLIIRATGHERRDKVHHRVLHVHLLQGPQCLTGTPATPDQAWATARERNSF